MLQFGMSRYVLLLWVWRKNYSSSFTLITTGRIETYQIATYSIRTLLKMDYWSPKHVELLNVMNKINHPILGILLDYRYIVVLSVSLFSRDLLHKGYVSCEVQSTRCSLILTFILFKYCQNIPISYFFVDSSVMETCYMNLKRMGTVDIKCFLMLRFNIIIPWPS